MSRAFGPRRASWITVTEEDVTSRDEQTSAQLTRFDLVYRSLVAVLFNFTQSGHPGGSVSSGRIVEGLLFEVMDYDIGDPNRLDQDLLSYAAGHKALGLYAMLALRDEVMRLMAPEMLPDDVRLRLRLEDLLGFRRNPTRTTPLFRRFGSKPLDGHPTPATPFVKLATGASGIGMGSSLGLAVAAADYFGNAAPKVHILDGEGGLTPGRVAETVSFGGTAGLSNAIVHLDWNQASIDSDAVTREGSRPGDYVQWDPMEFFYLHDWNVVEVTDGFDFKMVSAGQRKALEFENSQPTAIVYRTVKGWQYGIEGRKSHGGGHSLCSPEYFAALEPLFGDKTLPTCSPDASEEEVEATYWTTLEAIRGVLAEDADTRETIVARVTTARTRLAEAARTARESAPNVDAVYRLSNPALTPDELVLKEGSGVALREALGSTLGYLNRGSGGAVLVGAADLLGSTAISKATDGFPVGFYHRDSNPGSRTLSVGGICEDGLAAVASGIASFGTHVAAVASYGAFIAPLSHIASRLHAIGNQMRHEIDGQPNRPFMVICGHAGLKTGEDGPTHADPQALQVIQENFAPGAAISLTPWDPQELWPLTAAAFAARPAVIFPFVTRPKERVLDRVSLGLAPASDAVNGVYLLRAASGSRDGTLVLQGSEVAYAFVDETMPLLAEAGIDLDVFYVASVELFDRLAPEQQSVIFGEERANEAMAVTGFTMPTMYRWIRSDLGRANTLFPFRSGHYLGSGTGEMVVHEAGLDGEGQFAQIRRYVDALAGR